MSDAKIETRIVVTNNFLKRPWVPEITEKQGLHFIKIDKWDRELNMFITGQGLDLSKTGRRDINTKFIEELQRLRTQACDAAVAAAHAVDDAMSEHPRKKQRKARPVDQDIVAPYLCISCPAIRRGDVEIDGLEMNVLFGVKNHTLWVECTSANLEYIRHGVLASKELGEVGRTWKPKGADPNPDHDDLGSADDLGDQQSPVVDVAALVDSTVATDT